MPLHIYKKIIPKGHKRTTSGNKNESIKLKHTTVQITQLGGCKVKVENNYRAKVCSFFGVSANGKALLGMPDIETLNILMVNCNTLDTKEADGAENHKTNTPTFQE